MPFYIQLLCFAALGIIANLKVLIQASAGKNRIKSSADCIFYNGLLFVFTSIASLLVLFDPSLPSSSTLLFAFLFGALSIVFQLVYLTAFTCGPVSLTTIISNFSVFFTSLFGAVFYRENFSLLKLAGLILIIVSFFLMVKSDRSDQKKINLKWLILAISSALAGASGTIIQKIYQKSTEPPQTKLFVSYSYLFAAALSFAVLLIMCFAGKKPTFKITKGVFLPTLAAGLILGLYQFGVTKLAGIADSMVMYPILSGFTMTSSLLLGIIFFRERLSIRQLIGMLTGVAAVVLIGL